MSPSCLPLHVPLLTGVWHQAASRQARPLAYSTLPTSSRPPTADRPGPQPALPTGWCSKVLRALPPQKCLLVGWDTKGDDVAVVTTDGGRTWSTYSFGVNTNVVGSITPLPARHPRDVPRLRLYDQAGPTSIARNDGRRGTLGTGAKEPAGGRIHQIAFPTSTEFVWFLQTPAPARGVPF